LNSKKDIKNNSDGKPTINDRTIQRTLSFFIKSDKPRYFKDCKVDCRDYWGCAQQFRCEHWIELNPSTYAKHYADWAGEYRV